MAFETKVDDVTLVKEIKRLSKAGEPITVLGLAETFGMTGAAIHRRIKVLKEAGMKFPEFSRRRRRKGRDVAALQAIMDEGEDTTTAAGDDDDDAPVVVKSKAGKAKKKPVVVDDDDDED